LRPIKQQPLENASTGIIAIGVGRRGETNLTTPKIRSAVIAAAGQATRMWPASKAIPKELFPLGKIPALGHLIFELVDAGIQRILVVTSPHGIDLIKKLLDPGLLPPKNVERDPLVQSFAAKIVKADIAIFNQAGAYGNATPLMQAAEIIGAEPCIYAFGDDIVLGENVTSELIDVYAHTGSPVMAAQEIEPARTRLFGILECSLEGRFQRIMRVIEKPPLGATPSNLASLGRYLVTPELMDELRAIKPGTNGEMWFVDAVIQRIAAGQPVFAYTLKAGKWFTVGDPEGYAEAVNAAVKI
jgi:UTP--glucose-1-phosphate uridylyltransferase